MPPIWVGDDEGTYHNWDLNRREHARARHQGRVNVLFFDGHVESPTLEYVFEDTSDAALVRWNRDRQPHRDRLCPTLSRST